MFAFVPTAATRLPSRAFMRPHSVNRKKALPSASVFVIPRATYMQTKSVQEEDPAAFEDDDATMGSMGPVYGMQMPKLSEEDKNFLDGATSNDDFMRRMTQIARRIDARRKRSMGMGEVSDNYRASLSRPQQPIAEGSYGDPRISSGDKYINDLAQNSQQKHKTSTDKLDEQENFTPWLNEGDRYLEDLARTSRGEQVLERISPPEAAHRKEPTNTNKIDSNQSTTDSVKDVEDEIAALQKQIMDIQNDAGKGNVDLANEKAAAFEKQISQLDFSSEESDNSSDVDEQIQALEGFLTQLKEEGIAEEEEGSDAGMKLQKVRDMVMQRTSQSSSSSLQQPEIKGLENTPGEMPTEEKIAAFQALRQQAQSARPSSGFSDPFNVTLPDKREKNDDGDEPSDDSLEEYESFGSGLGDKNLIIEEIETEVKSYLKESKALLQKHESRMSLLLARLHTL